jgi:hypothetical protein
MYYVKIHHSGSIKIILEKLYISPLIVFNFPLPTYLLSLYTMESILPEPMQLDDDLDATLQAFSDLRINAPKRKSAKKTRSDQCLRYRQNP